MTSLKRILTFTTSCAVLLAVAIVPSATASSGQRSVFQDDAYLMSGNPVLRDQALDDMKSLGVDIVKIAVIWRNSVPGAESTSKPGGFDADNPDHYAGDVTVAQQTVAAIRARGMEPWVMVSAPAPKWASPKDGFKRPGVVKPNAKEFARFVGAAGRALPGVDIWSIYNEPNHRYWLEPQVVKRGVVESARLYRNIYVAAQKALAGAGHADDTILFGALAPRAGDPKPRVPSTRPAHFLREFFCLDQNLRPFRGSEAKKRGCTSFKKIRATGFAYHPYSNLPSPLARPAHRDDAPVRYLKRMYRVLDKAAAYGRAPRKLKLWNAEFAFQTNPPDIFWFPLARVPEYLNVSEYLSWKDPRVATYSQYQLTDEPLNRSFPVGAGNRYAAFQSGLRTEDGAAKPGVYSAWRMPLIVEKSSSNRVKVWGCVRPGRGTSPTVEIQVKTGGGFSTVKTLAVGNSAGYFQTVITRPGASRETWRILWSGMASRDAKAISRVQAKS